MRKFFKHISCLFLILLPLLMRGQDLPSLPVAKEIATGRLPDGIRIYLVDNKSRKGFADFALVQRGVRDIAGARASLRGLPHFGTRAPYRFLADHGIGYAGDGFISQPAEDATLFRFRNVPTHLESVADSTLLMLFEIASSCREPQAVIVCGDIDAARIRERMELLSMMVPTLDDSFQKVEYQWVPRDSVAVPVTHNTTRDLAAVNTIFSTQRLPAELMNTPQPLVTQTYADQLGLILRQRVERSFRQAGIPLASFRYRYYDSAGGPGDERHSITVYTAFRQLEAATRQLASVLGSLDRDGAGMAEFRDTRDRLVARARRGGESARLSNEDYLDRCLASYLYGANLASAKTVADFVANRRLDDERELELFNGFAAALLDSARNLTLRFDIPDRGLSRERLLHAFGRGWREAASPGDYKAAFGDTLSLWQPRKRVRLRADAEEPVSGGRLWTFSNGIKVIYRHMPGAGEFRYALLLRGGVAEVPGLRAGESAFVGDMLGLSGVAGLSGTDFREMLAASGITMDTEATLSDLRITGRAPRAKLPLLMRALLSLSDTRQPDPEAFAYYRRSEALRLEMDALSPRDVNSLMDSIIHPDYFYTGRKRAESLQEDLPQRAEQYFASLFDKVGDGVFVFLGDLPEEELKKELCRTLGDFRVNNLHARRPQVEKRSATGLSTWTAESAPGVVGGGEIGVNVALSAAIPFNLQNKTAFQVACSIVEKRLTAALAEQGAGAELTGEAEIFPDERFSLYVNCRPCPASGLPAGVVPADPPALLDAVRSVTRTLADTPLSEADIKAYKDLLLKQMESRMGDPGALLGDVLARYGEGKDLVTGYKAAIQGVNAGQVARILRLLSDGAMVEYMII